MAALEQTADEPDARILKRGYARTVLLLPGPHGDTVVKRFHHPNPLQALRDPLRALAEARALRRLAREGLAVPRLLGSPHLRRPVEVHMEAVPGAVSLDDLLLGTRSRPVDWRDLVERLGVLLAHLEASNVLHTDLHPGNILVDESGGPWLIDFHAAKRRRHSPSTAELRQGLVQAAAASREALTARLRVRFLRAWMRALPCTIRPRRPDLLELESLARFERRAVVRHGAGRHLRDSARCKETRAPNATVLSALWPGPMGTADRLLTFEEPHDKMRERWLSAARLVEHGIPVAIPHELRLQGTKAQATFEVRLSPSAHGRPLPADPSAAWGRLAGLLHDRGLDLPSWEEASLVPLAKGAGPRGSLLAPPAALCDLDPLEAMDRFRGTALPHEDTSFRSAYLEAFADRPGERAAVERLIR